MSKYLNESLAEEAIDLAMHTIKAAQQSGLAKRTDGCIVVAVRNGRTDGEHRFVTQRSLGDIDNWGHPYDEVANSKVVISCNTGLATREVQLLRPWLVGSGDTIYFGSAIQDDIVVAFSGVDAYVDEMIAKIVLAIILTLIERELIKQKEAGATTFLPA